MHVLLVGPEFEENLSLRYLAAALQTAGHTWSLSRFDGLLNLDSVVEQVMREQPGLVGLSIVFQVRGREFMELAAALRTTGYRGHITGGGHFATFACEELLRDYPALSSIIRQEGEGALSELAAALSSGRNKDLASIPGIVIRSPHGGVRYGATRNQTSDLNCFPFPVRDGEPQKHLGVPVAYMVGSRGCYADCDYCSIFAWHEAAIGKRYRLRSVQNIADEMASLYHDRGARFFVFHDDNFFLPTAAANRRRFLELKEAIDSRGLTGIGLMLKMRPNDCDPDNVALLRSMGLMRAFIGIENASRRQMKTLGRNTTQDDILQCLSTLRAHNIYCTFNILLFDPYTTLQDVRENARFLRRNIVHPFNWCKVEPYAGTALLKRYAAEGRLTGDYMGYGYSIDDPRASLLYKILEPAIHYRNFHYFGLSNVNIGLGYHLRLLQQFHGATISEKLVRGVRRVTKAINRDAIEMIEEAERYCRTAVLSDTAAHEEYARKLRDRSFATQRTLGVEAEQYFVEIERLADVSGARTAGISEAFTPLSAAVRNEPVGRRKLIKSLVGATAAVALAAGCRSPENPGLTPLPVDAKFDRIVIDVEPGKPRIVGPDEPLRLIARVATTKLVLGEPRLSSSAKGVQMKEVLDDGKALVIEVKAGDLSEYNPNGEVSVSWTLRGSTSDVVVTSHAIFHKEPDGGTAMGEVQARVHIAEMAAPPIHHSTPGT